MSASSSTRQKGKSQQLVSMTIVATSIDIVKDPVTHQEQAYASGYDMNSNEPVSIRLKNKEELEMLYLMKKQKLLHIVDENNQTIKFSRKLPGQSFKNYTQSEIDLMKVKFHDEMNKFTKSAQSLETIQTKQSRIQQKQNQPNPNNNQANMTVLRFDQVNQVATVQGRKVFSAKAVVLGGNDKAMDQSGFCLKNVYAHLDIKKGGKKADVIVLDTISKMQIPKPETIGTTQAQIDQNQLIANENVNILVKAFATGVNYKKHLAGQESNSQISTSRIPVNTIKVNYSADDGARKTFSFPLYNIYEEHKRIEDGREKTFFKPKEFENAFVEYMSLNDPNTDRLIEAAEKKEEITPEMLEQAYKADRVRMLFSVVTNQPLESALTSKIKQQISDQELSENFSKYQRSVQATYNMMRSPNRNCEIQMITAQRFPLAPKMWANHLSQRAEIEGGQFSAFGTFNQEDGKLETGLNNQGRYDPVYVKSIVPLTSFTKASIEEGRFAPNLFADYSNEINGKKGQAEILRQSQLTDAHSVKNENILILNEESFKPILPFNEILQAAQRSLIDQQQEVENNLTRDMLLQQSAMAVGQPVEQLQKSWNLPVRNNSSYAQDSNVKKENDMAHAPFG